MFRVRYMLKTANGYCNKVRNKISASCLKEFTIKDIPRPRSLPIIGTKLDLIAAGGGMKLHEYVDKRHKQLGPIFTEKLSTANIVFVSDPQLMKQLFLKIEGKYPTHILPDPWVLYEKLYNYKRGLFFMDGEEWLLNRRIMNKHLLREDSEKWLEGPLNATIQKFIHNFKCKIKNGDIPCLESDLYKLSTDSVIAILMGSDSSLQDNLKFEKLLNRFSKVVKRIFEATTKLYTFPATFYQRLNLKAWKDFKESVDASLLIAHKIVKEMLDKKDINNGLIRKLCNENLSNEIITRIVADFVIAAGDTTSYTTLWTLFLLSSNKDVVEEIRDNNSINVKNVIREAMRLYPVAPFLTRILPKDSLLGPYKLNKGTPVVASIYTSGRDEKYFSKANMFLPYRWDKNDARRKDLENHEPSASLPFALGSRSCIGKKIAMIQLTQITKQLVDNFEFKCRDENTGMKAVTSGVLVPDRPLNLVFSVRK